MTGGKQTVQEHKRTLAFHYIHSVDDQ